MNEYITNCLPDRIPLFLFVWNLVCVCLFVCFSFRNYYYYSYFDQKKKKIRSNNVFENEWDRFFIRCADMGTKCDRRILPGTLIFLKVQPSS